MRGSREKEDILKNNGYRYHFTRMIYFNIDKKKIFSSEWVEDNSEAMLKKKIAEKNKDEWQFYFSGEIASDLLKKEVIKELKG